MPAIGTSVVFELRDFQTFFGSTFLNVYHYVQDTAGTADSASNVAAAFLTTVLPDILAMQSESLEHTLIEVEQLGSLTNYTTLVLIGADGTETGSDMPQYNSAAFKLVRTTKETRNGSKRIAGMTEENVTGNNFTAGFKTEMDGVAATLESPLVSGSITHLPAIVGGKYDTTVTPAVLKPVANWVYNPISSVAASSRVTTQNTRKVGRGI
jgi:hypothetical protein